MKTNACLEFLLNVMGTVHCGEVKERRKPSSSCGRNVNLELSGGLSHEPHGVDTPKDVVADWTLFIQKF